jgi:hypothetical protein
MNDSLRSITEFYDDDRPPEQNIHSMESSFGNILQLSTIFAILMCRNQ